VFEQINTMMMMTMMMFCGSCNLKGKRRRVVVYDCPVKAIASGRHWQIGKYGFSNRIII